MRANEEGDFWAQVRVGGIDECWDFQGSKWSTGYGRFQWRGRSVKAHRLAWELAHGPIPDGLLACHHCDRPACCNPRHLFVSTTQGNTQDRHQKGRDAKGSTHVSRTKPERVPRGERHGSRTKPERLARGDENGSRLHPELLKRGEDAPSAKLTEDQVKELRRVYAAGGVRQVDLAARFGITQSQVSKILRGAAWAHATLAGTGGKVDG